MVASEAMNFVAYIFAPATVVAPLGALQIVACAIIAWIFLKEHLNVFGQVGCVLTIIGTSLIVIFAPESDALANVWELWLAFLHPGTVHNDGPVHTTLPPNSIPFHSTLTAY